MTDIGTCENCKEDNELLDIFGECETCSTTSRGEFIPVHCDGCYEDTCADYGCAVKLGLEHTNILENL